MRPVIGITCAWSDETWGTEPGQYNYDYAGRDYGKAIYRAGGLPVLIPPIAEGEDVETYIETLLQRLDGVYFSGGGNGRKRHPDGVIPTLYAQQVTRSSWEDALMKAVYRKDIPTLGVCRGHQMMAVALGGTMDTVRMPSHRQTTPADQVCHSISIVEGSLLAQVAGSQDWPVNSLHVERVMTVPEGFIASARAADGSIEAIESQEKTFFMGTQFHPELMPEDVRAQNVLRAFISAAKSRS